MNGSMSRHALARHLLPKVVGAVLSVLAVASLLAACSTAGADKSGVKAPPTVLTLVSNDGANLAGAPAVQEFVDQVAQLSGGTVTVKALPSPNDGSAEVQVLHKVIAGDADLGWVGTRALDEIGFTALTPINAPFLVGSYAAQASVVNDAFVERQFSGIDAHGLIGLTLLADELRFPVGISRPFLRPKDYVGARVRTMTSGIQSAGLAALGATPTDVQIHADEHPPLSGFETMWWTYNSNGYADLAKFPTINTPLWPRTVALVANPASLSRLSNEQRSWVEQAAANARTWSVQHASDPVQQEIDQACVQGAKIASSSPAQVTALKSAVAPFYHRLASRPETAAVFRRVRQLATVAPADPPTTLPTGCAFTPADLKTVPKPLLKLTAPGQDGTFPTGVFRLTSTFHDLVAIGMSAADARLNAGTYTYTLRDGRWHYDQKPDYPEGTQTSCSGFYDVKGSSITFATTTVLPDGDCMPTAFMSHWSFADSTLSWSGTVVDDPVFAHMWDSSHWTKIG